VSAPSQHLDAAVTGADTARTLIGMSRQVLVKRRAVDLCRVATCLCPAS